MPEPCEHCCHEPTFKAIERQQAPYRGLFQAMVGYIHDLPFDRPIYRQELDQLIVRLWKEQPDAARMVQRRTTRYGREDED